MSAYTGTNDRVNGGALAGQHLVGSLDFYQVATIVPVGQTNVDTPVSLLYTQQGYSTWQTVTVVDGAGVAQTYSTQTSYQDAFNKQANLNLLVQLFATRANPVAMYLDAATISNPSITTAYPSFLNTATFGSAYTSSVTVTTVKFITERSNLWLVSNPAVDTNTDGYEFLDFIQGITVVDLATPVLQTSVFETQSATNTNTIAYRNSTL